MKNFDENDFYYIYVLGYDLLHETLKKCKQNENDSTFDACKEIYEWYLSTNYAKNYKKSGYDCLHDFVDDNMFAIKQFLFNKLDYPIMSD